MEYLIHIFYGVVMAYLGLLAPGMLNMTALRTSLQVGKKEGVEFALGASIVVFIQAGIALYFADYFEQNPHIIKYLKYAGIIVFFTLSFVFFRLSKKELEPKNNVARNHFLIKGMTMSSINMLAIPFYLAMSILLVSLERITIQHPYIFFFVFGAAFGSFLLFITYISFAKLIQQKLSFIAKNINLILAILFFVLGISTLLKVFI